MGWAAIAAIIVVLPMQFGRGNLLPRLDPTDGVTAFVEQYVAGTPAEVVEVELDGGITEIGIVVASSLPAPSVSALAERLAEYLSSPVEVRLLVASTSTESATSAPSPGLPRPNRQLWGLLLGALLVNLGLSWVGGGVSDATGWRRERDRVRAPGAGVC